MFFLLLCKRYLWAKIRANGHNLADFKRNTTGDTNVTPKFNEIAIEMLFWMELTFLNNSDFLL